MKVVHKINNLVLEKETENTNFLLTNKVGGYASFSKPLISRYQGAFFFENNQMYKVINDISLVENKEVTKIVNKFWCVDRESGNITETFFMPHAHNALVYELNTLQNVNVTLDCRESYDGREFGRYYEVSEEEGKIIVRFTKKNDKNEPSGDEFVVYLVIAPLGSKYEITGRWESCYYRFDKERNSYPFERYVYNVLNVRSKRIIFAFGKTREKAIEEADSVLKDLEYLKKAQQEYVEGLLVPKSIKNLDANMAYLCAVNSIDGLLNNTNKVPGVYAGLYFFWQYWIRDEAMSLKSLMSQKNYDIIKKILIRQMRSITHEGLAFSIYPDMGLKSADGAGWIFKRFDDLISCLEKEKLVNKYLTREELAEVRNKLESVIAGLVKNRSSQGLIVNKDNETWMDTSYNGDTRDGARIEIQALTLSMLKLFKNIYRLENDSKNYEKITRFEQKFARTVKEKLWDGKVLADGLKDFTVRPNVFIACYVYPELLTKDEWVICFNNMIPKLWNGWGGLSTIDKTSSLYVENHTGEDNRSYHRGDSWYHINNMAAIVLNRTDNKSFKAYTDKILEASTNEILWGGVIGSHAEISSSSKPESKGCLSQAWANAMYIELVNSLFL